MSLIDQLPHTAAIHHVSYSQDDGGLGGETENNQAAYVVAEPAWFQPLSTSEVNKYGQRNQEVSHKVYLQRDPGLRLDDRLIAASGLRTCPWAGREFSFVAFDEATAGFGLLWKAIVKIETEPTP
jgi:hypothetical protein